VIESRWSGSISSSFILTNHNDLGHPQTLSHFPSISRRATLLLTSLTAQTAFLTWAILSTILILSRSGQNGIQRQKSHVAQPRLTSAKKTGSGTISGSLRLKLGHSIPRTQRGGVITRRATSWILSSLRLRQCPHLRNARTQRPTRSNRLLSRYLCTRLCNSRFSLPAGRIITNPRSHT
jgi:hypothetical protein